MQALSRYGFIAIGVVWLASCSSLRTVPVIQTAPTLQEAPECATATGKQKGLCDGLAAVSSLSTAYAAAANNESLTDSFFGYQSILSAVAIAGFSLFDAHPDNIKAATLVGGLTSIGRTQLKPAARSKIYRDANEALTCVHAAGREFLGANDLSPDIQLAVDRLYQWRVSTSGLSIAAPEEGAKTSQSLDGLQTQISASREVQAARNSAPSKISQALTNIRTTANRLVDAQSPDIAAIVTAITQLSKTTDSATSDGGADVPFSDLRFDGTTKAAAENALKRISGDADALRERLGNSTGSPGQQELQNISTCISAFE